MKTVAAGFAAGALLAVIQSVTCGDESFGISGRRSAIAVFRDPGQSQAGDGIECDPCSQVGKRQGHEKACVEGAPSDRKACGRHTDARMASMFSSESTRSVFRIEQSLLAGISGLLQERRSL